MGFSALCSVVVYVALICCVVLCCVVVWDAETYYISVPVFYNRFQK